MLSFQDFLQPALRLNLVNKSFVKDGVFRCRTGQIQHVNTAGRHFDRCGKPNHFPGDSIPADGIILKNVLETFHGNHLLLVAAIQHHQHGVLAVRPGIYIALGGIVGGIMDEAAIRHRGGAAAPVEQFAGKVPALVLVFRTSLPCEGAARVSGPSTGEIGPEGIPATHRNLRSVVDLRDAAGGEEESQALLEFPGRFSRFHEAGNVVIIQEGEHTGRIRDQEVLRDALVQLEKTGLGAFGGIAFPEHLLFGREGEVEVHHRLQVRIGTVQGRSPLPPSGGRIARIPAFAHNVKIRVFLFYFLAPAHHEVVIGIGVGIHPDAIDAGIFYPPYAVLNQIGGQVAIPLVQVRHASREPAVYQYLFFALGRMGVHQGPFIMCGGLQAFYPAPSAALSGLGLRTRLPGHLAHAASHIVLVEPIGIRDILHPPVGTATVVENHIHNHLEAFPVSGVYEVAILFIASQAGIHLVIVGNGIAM